MRGRGQPAPCWRLRLSAADGTPSAGAPARGRGWPTPCYHFLPRAPLRAVHPWVPCPARPHGHGGAWGWVPTTHTFPVCGSSRYHAVTAAAPVAYGTGPAQRCGGSRRGECRAHTLSGSGAARGLWHRPPSAPPRGSVRGQHRGCERCGAGAPMAPAPPQRPPADRRGESRRSNFPEPVRPPAAPCYGVRPQPRAKSCHSRRHPRSGSGAIW